MGLIKLASSNEDYSYNVKRTWKGRGKGALIGGGIGAAGVAAAATTLAKDLDLSKSKAALLGVAAGSILGGISGARIGDIASKLKQHADHNRRDGHKHPTLRAWTPSAFIEHVRGTSAVNHLKMADPVGALVSTISRGLSKKKQ